MLNKQVLPDLIRHFVVFHQNKDQLIKIVPKIVPATTSTLLTLDNPTLVVLTDRNDLDDQLFDTFSLSQDLLRQTPVKAENLDRLKGLLSVTSGGIVFTTIQKFLPEIVEKIELGDGKYKNIKGQFDELSDRRNIVVIADEAHRSQYDFMDGFARHPARCPTQRLLHRLHRYPHRKHRQEYAGRIRRLHRLIRHSAGRRRRGRSQDFLRKSPSQNQAEKRRRSTKWTSNLRWWEQK